MDSDIITAQLTYIMPPPNGGRAYQLFSSRTGELEEANIVPALHDMFIENVRGKEDSYTLDDAGFQFFHRPTKHTDFDDEKELEEYYWESTEIVKEVTGASDVIFSSSMQRSRVVRELDDLKPKQWRPAGQVHVDQLDRLRERGLEPRRWQIINLWRPIGHAAYDWPLACCTWNSVDLESDIYTLERRTDHGRRINETRGVKYNPNHQWKYVRGMSPSDIVLLKTFDSDEGVARFTPHTAFEDPTTPENAPPRKSIELRLLVVYN
ncbi:hypothetical protein L218DRAFT_876913 [Marasmius fiardii PR-910]|nr:hypothetical protein L218DRAFT_876913 [Marasmius fiardii PR-910]